MHALQQLFDEAEIETRSYSGRSMYGKECLAVDLNKGLGDFIADVLYAMQEPARRRGEAHDEIAEAFRGMVTDSMGRGIIVYFPGVPFEVDGEEGAEGDDDVEDENA